ncbi:hypothetical protein LIA77_04044 [Sarocladium implicatum]|nr:hypothetical protein LIA77_04044 [Sarocladium implicatum]
MRSATMSPQKVFIAQFIRDQLGSRPFSLAVWRWIKSFPGQDFAPGYMQAKSVATCPALRFPWIR